MMRDSRKIKFIEKYVIYLRKFPRGGSVNLGKVGCIFTHF